MLKEVAIQNFAIIDHLTVSFDSGLNIITGETGAGKSILLGALGLVLGERAEASALMDKEKKCIIEGCFKGNQQTADWLQLQSIDNETEITIRREISTSGKSRAFINDTPVNLSQLKKFTSLLVDIHQQFDTLELGEAYFQREVLDAMAGCIKEAEQYRKKFLIFSKLSRETEALKQQQQQLAKEQDYNRYLLEELTNAAFKENELEQIEQELKLMNNSAAIASTLEDAVYLLQSGELPVVQQLKSLLQKMHPFKDINASIKSVFNRLQSTHIELNDISNELQHLQNTITLDEERIHEINERMEIGYKLQKKHGAKTTADLLEIQRNLESKLEAVANTDHLVTLKEKELEVIRKQLEKEARDLSKKRNEQVPLFVESVNKLLTKVGMPNARLKVEITEDSLNIYGIDTIHFLFDANKSNRFEPINKVASGGELSRLMLCIKSLVAKNIALPSMLFDEIDTGISGEAARQVGILLKELTSNHQVITITHLPQIAAKANAHYFVYKEEEKGKITTKIRLLNKEEQIEKVAKMLNGEQLTNSSLQTAREMMLS